MGASVGQGAQGESMIVPAWLTWARAEVGTTEIVGPKHEQRVLEYWDIGKVPLDVNDDETPWCAAFACAAIEATAHNRYRSPRTARARGFEPGPHTKVCDNVVGAIVVLSSDRGAASGHVGFLESVSKDRVLLLGGNQGNRVCVASFPLERVVAVVWPAGAPDHTRYPLAQSTTKVSPTIVSDR